jgi:hypothetical protein
MFISTSPVFQDEDEEDEEEDEETMTYSQKSESELDVDEQWLKVADALRDVSKDSFFDPFIGVDDLKGRVSVDEDDDVAVEEQATEKARLSQSLSMLDALDGYDAARSHDLAVNMSKSLKDDWDIIAFGAMPALDHEHYLMRMPLSTRRKINKFRAELAMRECLSTVEFTPSGELHSLSCPSVKPVT